MLRKEPTSVCSVAEHTSVKPNAVTCYRASTRRATGNTGMGGAAFELIMGGGWVVGGVVVRGQGSGSTTFEMAEGEMGIIVNEAL